MSEITNEFIDRIVAALRDTAAKGVETREEAYVDYDHTQYLGRQEVTRTRKVEAYSREWLVGRIEGMADTLEAMMGQPRVAYTNPAVDAGTP